MVKTSMSSTKYIIFGEFKVEGYIDKPDLIGSFFGQTEGLIGEDLDFQNLQKTGKIGRIEIDLKKSSGITKGKFSIPTSLDRVEVSLVAAAIESIKKIGHTNGEIKIIEIKDDREEKRKLVLKRAEELLNELKEELPDSIEISNNIKSNVSKKLITKYGKEYYGGPNIKNSLDLILVEGRADVLNLLKHGIENVISFNGSKKLSNYFFELVKDKNITLFLDDDVAGKKESKVLIDKLDPDYLCFAPNGKEVEELNYKEIIKALKNKKSLKENNKLEEEISIEEIKNIVIKKLKNELINKFEQSKPIVKKVKNDLIKTAKEKLKVDSSTCFEKEQFEKIEYLINKIKNKDLFILLNNDFRQIKVGNIGDLNSLKSNRGKILIFDGVCENSILKKAEELGINLIVCKSRNKSLKKTNLKIKLFKDFTRD